MSRPAPKSPPPAVAKGERTGWVKQNRTYKVITPLFGGGEETQKADSITTVRATEVRGHLRFWWRATRGGEFGGSLEKMKESEDAIWGSSAEKGKPGASDVKIAVRIINSGVEDSPFEVVSNKKNKPTLKAREGSAAHPYPSFPQIGRAHV